MANNNCGSPCRVRALIPCIVDSCQQCAELVQQISIPMPPMDIAPAALSCADPLSVITTIPCAICGDIKADVIGTTTECNEVATTVLFKIPVAFFSCAGCVTEPFYQTVLTDVRTFRLKGCEASQFELLNCNVQSVHCVITGVNCGELNVTVNILKKVFVGQTIVQEMLIPASKPLPVRNCDNGCLVTYR